MYINNTSLLAVPDPVLGPEHELLVLPGELLDVLPPVDLIHVPLRVEVLQGTVDRLERPLRFHVDVR